jgi:type II secretory pathway pseudopilin PulG
MITILLRKRAMTLLEIVITVMLISIVIGAGIMPFVMQQGMLRTHMARSDIQDQVSIAMAYINKDVFRASSTSIPADGSTLTLEMRSITNVLSNTIVYARSVSAGTISRTHTDHTGAANVTTSSNIAQHITSLTFTSQGNNLVGVTITAEREGQAITSSTAFALRGTRAIL